MDGIRRVVAAEEALPPTFHILSPLEQHTPSQLEAAEQEQLTRLHLEVLVAAQTFRAPLGLSRRAAEEGAVDMIQMEYRRPLVQEVEEEPTGMHPDRAEQVDLKETAAATAVLARAAAVVVQAAQEQLEPPRVEMAVMV